MSHLTIILQKVSLSSFHCTVSFNKDPLRVRGMTEDPLWVHRVFNEDPLCVRGMNERMEAGRNDRGGFKNKPSIEELVSLQTGILAPNRSPPSHTPRQTVWTYLSERIISSLFLRISHHKWLRLLRANMAQKLYQEPNNQISHKVWVEEVNLALSSLSFFPDAAN